jgi:hypothetical protein
MSSRLELGQVVFGLLLGLAVLGCGLRRIEPIGVRGDPTGDAEVVSSVETQVSADLLAPTVRLQGIVVLPEEWGVSRFEMRAEPFQPKDGGDGSAFIPWNRVIQLGEPPDAWRFCFPEIHPGAHVVTVDPPGWRTVVSVGADGLEDERLEVPSPGHVSVRLTLEGSQAPADVDSILWDQFVDAGLAKKWSTVKPTSGTGAFEFVVPAGWITISVDDDRYCCFSRSMVVQPKSSAFEFSIAKASGFVLRAREAGLQVPVDPLDVTAARLDGWGKWERVRAEGLDQRFTVTSPGRYRVRIRSPEGNGNFECREIVIAPGRYAEVEFDLECRN